MCCITAPLIVVLSFSLSLSRRRVDLDEDGGDGGVAPLLGQPLRLVQLEVRVRRRRCRGSAIFEKRVRQCIVQHLRVYGKGYVPKHKSLDSPTSWFNRFNRIFIETDISRVSGLVVVTCTGMVKNIRPRWVTRHGESRNLGSTFFS